MRMMRPMEVLRATGCQPVAFGSLPNDSSFHWAENKCRFWRQAGANNRLAACAPQT